MMFLPNFKFDKRLIQGRTQEFLRGGGPNVFT